MKRFSIIVVLLLVAVGGQRAAAAVQGTLGATSTFLINVQINVARSVRIFRLTDINLGLYDLSQNAQFAQDVFCIYDSGAAFGVGTYNITFNGTNTPGAFELTFAGNNIPYQVEFDDTNTGAGLNVVTPNVPVSGNGNASQSTGNCGSTGAADNAMVRVTVFKTDVTSALEGTYTDTLQITVAPDP